MRENYDIEDEVDGDRVLEECFDDDNDHVYFFIEDNVKCKNECKIQIKIEMRITTRTTVTIKRKVTKKFCKDGDCVFFCFVIYILTNKNKNDLIF